MINDYNIPYTSSLTYLLQNRCVMIVICYWRSRKQMQQLSLFSCFRPRRHAVTCAVGQTVKIMYVSLSANALKDCPDVLIRHPVALESVLEHRARLTVVQLRVTRR